MVEEEEVRKRVEEGVADRVEEELEKRREEIENEVERRVVAAKLEMEVPWLVSCHLNHLDTPELTLTSRTAINQSSVLLYRLQC